MLGGAERSAVRQRPRRSVSEPQWVSSSVSSRDPKVLGGVWWGVGGGNIKTACNLEERTCASEVPCGAPRQGDSFRPYLAL